MDKQQNDILRFHLMWVQRRRQIATLVILLAVYWFKRKKRRNYVDKPITQSEIERQITRDKLMNELRVSEKCRNITRMGPEAFQNFCEMLIRDGGLRPTKRARVEEQVAKFLHIISHNVRNRTMSFFFCRSGETISRHFHSVLKAVISLEGQFLKQPSGLDVPPEILNNDRFHPYFKNCIGAIDGTHVRVKVSNEDAPRYRGRKNYPTVNVLAACSFDMKFTYVLPGWEGTASDSRVMASALKRQGDKLILPEGKFYLADAGYPLKAGLITPYRGVRYHLKEYASRRPENPRELFNLRHASLRNVIERIFGVLKKRFPIIGSSTEPTYDVKTQVDIILACCIIHNYLMGMDPDESLFNEVDRELLNETPHEEHGPMERSEDHSLGEHLRDSITSHMWHDYVANHV
ncbi:uncharacterized protein LOC132276683 isoform X1 [Cornus florida]|uniref:uncharacterized protein LOC132276683 isoform X1 n=1 Tax=Cornus florida TaxID=4283 RepID=UPI0028A1D384|nr:uncharacterized protein LOC132276683 isoform X1 [Cornus florida]